MQPTCSIVKLAVVQCYTAVCGSTQEVAEPQLIKIPLTTGVHVVVCDDSALDYCAVCLYMYMYRYANMSMVHGSLTACWKKPLCMSRAKGLG